ncbi:condensation domain-containing protein [Streptomyces sp. B6B3]|uniref:condensation domain-containing protein n=1 Tax=Streptomyces sp. B6B3 TaxID=3153570 RepID=UPI00325D2665
MHELHQRGAPIEGLHQSVVVWAPSELTLNGLTAALQALLDQHAALRIRLQRDGSSDWSLEILPPGSVRADALVRRVDIAAVADCEVADVLRRETSSAVSALRPEAGLMLQVVWCDAGERALGRLLLVAHHLSVDGVSWRIMTADLASAWADVVMGREPALAPVGTSFRSWATALDAAAHDPERTAELALWQKTLKSPSPLSPPTRTHETASAAGVRRTVLPKDTTRDLITAVTEAFHADMNDVLLTALGLAVADWRREQGQAVPGYNHVLVDLERHGREEQVVPGSDLSRTVGWFTSMHPVRLNLGNVDWRDVWAGGPEIGRVLKNVKEQVRDVPDHGIGYGLLRYLDEETGQALAELPTPPIVLNYLGRTPTAESARPTAWTVVPDEGDGNSGHETDRVSRTIEIDALVRNTADGPEMVAYWAFDRGLISDAAVRRIIDGWLRALTALVTCTKESNAGGRTPSDLDLISLTQEDIENLEMEWGL